MLRWLPFYSWFDESLGVSKAGAENSLWLSFYFSASEPTSYMRSENDMNCWDCSSRTVDKGKSLLIRTVTTGRVLHYSSSESELLLMKSCMRWRPIVFRVTCLAAALFWFIISSSAMPESSLSEPIPMPGYLCS